MSMTRVLQYRYLTHYASTKFQALYSTQLKGIENNHCLHLSQIFLYSVYASIQITILRCFPLLPNVRKGKSENYTYPVS